MRIKVIFLHNLLKIHNDEHLYEFNMSALALPDFCYVMAPTSRNK